MSCRCYLYLFVSNIFVKFGFVSDRVCDFAIKFRINVINIFQILGFLASLERKGVNDYT